MNKGTCIAKKKNRIEKFESQNLRTGYQQKTQKLRTRRKAKRRCKSVDVDVIKFKTQM